MDGCAPEVATIFVRSVVKKREAGGSQTFDTPCRIVDGAVVWGDVGDGEAWGGFSILWVWAWESEIGDFLFGRVNVRVGF